MSAKSEKVRFSKPFWVASTVEMLERMAYYAVFIVLTIYLSDILGFTDVEAGLISGIFSGGLYLLPTFSGAIADKIGFRKSMLLAFSLLTIGYIGLGAFPSFFESKGLVEYAETTTFKGIEDSSMRWNIVPVLLFIMVGGSFIKSIISGTVAKETSPENRAKGYSLFYMMVNIGAFTGKTIVEPLRRGLGSEGLVVLNYFSAAMTFMSLLLIYFMYHSSHTEGEGKSMKELLSALGKVVTNGKLIAITLIVSGFWTVYYQLYATMPKYVIRMVGEDATPAWYANMNPLIVVLLVNFVTNMMRKKRAVTSMTIGMLLMPIAALTMASGNLLHVDSILGLHPVAFMMIVGIAFQALAETFISPRFLEYFSLYAPKGDEGLYLGFSHINSFISSLLSFGLSGFLLAKYCPDPKLFDSHEAWQVASSHAHYIWYYFAVIGLVSSIALYIFGKLTKNTEERA